MPAMTADDGRRRPLAARLDEPGGQGRETEGDRRRPEQVEMTRRVRIDALGHVPSGEQHESGQRQVDEERPPPRRSVDEPSADEGPRRARNAHEPRPRTDRAPSILLADRRRKQGQAARHEQGGSDSLQAPGPR